MNFNILYFHDIAVPEQHHTAIDLGAKVQLHYSYQVSIKRIDEIKTL